MKTAIFLNTFAKMANYDFKNLSEYNIRKIALISEDQYQKFYDIYEIYFDEIYSCPIFQKKGLEKIDFHFAKEIVKNELLLNMQVKIICLSEDNLLLAAKLRDEFNIPGMKFQQALTFRNKILMKDVVKNKGIRTPKYELFDIKQFENISIYFDNLKENIGLPFVLKPIDLLGSLGIYIINNFEEFETFCKEKHLNSIYEVEEFISGQLFHCDSIRLNGKTIFSTCCQYSRPNFDLQLGKPIFSFPLLKDDPLSKYIFKFNESVLEALNLNDGISHHEVFLNDNKELIFLEIAARSPGGLITPMYRHAFNVGLEDIDFKIQMDIPFNITCKNEIHVLSGVFPMFSGKVTKLLSPKLKSKYKMNWYIDEGNNTVASSSLRDQSASIIAWNKDYNILRDDFNILHDFKNVLIE